uniref:Uncharacterized protein n=1 Tax=Arundo donax TaxID=35708 RepID=A0A0A9EEI4_ARUDO
MAGPAGSPARATSGPAAAGSPPCSPSPKP